MISIEHVPRSQHPEKNGPTGYKPWVDPCRENVYDLDWPTQSMAHAVGMGQLAYYKLLAGRGDIKILTTASGLREHLDEWEADPVSTPVGIIITLEGADPVTTPAELEQWHGLGLRTLMLAHFGQSRYAHGTPGSMGDGDTNPHDIDGPLSDMGRQLLPIMHRLKMPLDLTHTADQTFAENGNAVPFGFFAFFARLFIAPAFRCGERQISDLAAIAECADFGVVADIPHEDNFID